MTFSGEARTQGPGDPFICLALTHFASPVHPQLGASVVPLQDTD